MVCPTCEGFGGPDAILKDGTPLYLKTVSDYSGLPLRLELCAEIFGKPYKMPKPTNPLHPNTPYPSKYFTDRRFEPPRELTADDIYKAMEELKEKIDG